MRVLCNTMEEMWDTEPEARITAGCAFERLAALLGASMIDTLYLTHDQHHATAHGVMTLPSNPANLFITGIPPPSYDHCTNGVGVNGHLPQSHTTTTVAADDPEAENLLAVNLQLLQQQQPPSLA